MRAGCLAKIVEGRKVDLLHIVCERVSVRESSGAGRERGAGGGQDKKKIRMQKKETPAESPLFSCSSR